MFGVAVFLAQVAPSRVTSGVYQVIVGEGTAMFILPPESLACSRSGDIVTCTAPVAGQQLTVDFKYFDPRSPIPPNPCTARHGDRPVLCGPRMGFYGHASNSVGIDDQLGVTEPELTRLRDAVPWWRTDNGVPLATLVLFGVLPPLMGVLAYPWGGRTRPRADTRRLAVAVGMGLLGLTLFAVSSLLFAPKQGIDHSSWLTVLLSPAVIPSAALAAWQWQLGGTVGDYRGQRWAYVIGAILATAFYTVAILILFLLDGGFVD
ncbi:MAG: hypothetical protein ACRDTG_17045 [Pseudonocardiaceae bacterium]